MPSATPPFNALRAVEAAPGNLAKVPLIHDDQLAKRSELPGWDDWVKVAGLPVELAGGSI